MSRLFRLWLGLAAITLAGPVAAGPAAVPRFLPEDAERVIGLLPAPPADDSLAGRADLETVLQVQADRTAAQVARAKAVVHHTAFDMGARVFGPWFTPANLPRTAAWLDEITRECHPVLVAAKERWQRARPYERDARVRPCVELPAHTSYPSGHSATAAIWAALFTAAFPEHQAALAAAARETMWCRVLAGVHFPTDTQAGYVLGSEIGRRLLASPAMPAALAEVRAEVEAFEREGRRPEPLAVPATAARPSATP